MTFVPASPTILHADMDAFYAAVEQHDHPELRGKPVIVGGTSNRGVVLTASYEARVYGVHSAMPGVQARQLCPHGIFVRGRMRRYSEVAAQIREVFREFTPLVEPLSLDEAFLDITGSLRLFGSAVEIGRQLRERVRRVTGLNVSVGIGPTKMIAKIASTTCKPDGLLLVPADGVEQFLHPLPVNHLWGVGPTMEAQLRRRGFTTIGSVADADPARLERQLGPFGRVLWALAHGRDARLVNPGRRRKSYGEEQTFERDQRDGEMIRRCIAEHAETVARRLRADGCRGRTVMLKLKLARRIAPGKYPIVTRRCTLPTAIDDGKAIASAALSLWDGARGAGLVRLIGVAVSGIEPAMPMQLPLFTAAEVRRRAALNEAMDQLVARFGEQALVRGPLAPPPRPRPR